MGLPLPITMTSGYPLRARGTIAERRRIGAYYTPQTVTDILSEWAIRSAKDIILEPGFGGCGFLESSANRLKVLGCIEPSAQLHGCDIDDHAFRILYTRLGLTQLSGHFVLGDFLSLGSEAFDAKLFDVAIGKPAHWPSSCAIMLLIPLTTISPSCSYQMKRIFENCLCQRSSKLTLATAALLRSRGVELLDYDSPPRVTVDGIARVEGNYPSKGIAELGCWFLDSERNMIGVGQSLT